MMAYLQFIETVYHLIAFRGKSCFQGNYDAKEYHLMLKFH